MKSLIPFIRFWKQSGKTTPCEIGVSYGGEYPSLNLLDYDAVQCSGRIPTFRGPCTHHRRELHPEDESRKVLTLKMEATRSSETVVFYSITTRCHNPQDHDVNASAAS